MKELGSAIATILLIVFFWFVYDAASLGRAVGAFLTAMGAKP